jgi:hypothetical protein
VCDNILRQRQVLGRASLSFSEFGRCKFSLALPPPSIGNRLAHRAIGARFTRARQPLHIEGSSDKGAN